MAGGKIFSLEHSYMNMDKYIGSKKYASYVGGLKCQTIMAIAIPIQGIKKPY
ncbi:hypothetical protein B4166_3344 [Caldibacillus thermoamylovorans]|uniref:Uncharacterized protein n=1 Tax=Caldibacillus thermoamylovorans TaxID=35841 RepID=A0ABD4A4S6_9BACI|nr:hypothetical protein B4166_3344 [Caldibacillus thermoamylovorans]KIO71832.1 hypothetical protein B4167_3301 [Caldibacillus thermoamylovorans]